MGRGSPKEVAKIAVLLVVAAATWWLAEWVKPPEPEEGAISRSGEPDAYLSGFLASEMNEIGRLQRQLTASRMDLYPQDNIALVTAPELTLLRDDAEPWVIRADQGQVFSQHNLMTLLGKVTIERHQPDQEFRLLTADAVIHTDRQTFTTNDSVFMQHPYGTTEGVGMAADLEAGTLSILASVKGQYVHP